MVDPDRLYKFVFACPNEVIINKSRLSESSNVRERTKRDVHVYSFCSGRQ